MPWHHKQPNNFIFNREKSTSNKKRMNISSFNVEQKTQKQNTISNLRDIFMAFRKGRSITLEKKKKKI